MPTYDYRCDACGHAFEQVQSFHDDALTVCPSCGAAAVKRVFNSVGVIFKGAGWYVNDTRTERGRRTGAREAAEPDANGAGALDGAKEGGAEAGAGSSAPDAGAPAGDGDASADRPAAAAAQGTQPAAPAPEAAPKKPKAPKPSS